MTENPPCTARREFLAALGCAGGAFALGLPGLLLAADTEHEWQWLLGNWDVQHRRLKERLAGSTDWETFGGKSALWLALGALGTIDDNIVELPGGTYRGLTVRAFDTATRQWSIWWLDGRNPTRIDVPVVGRFSGDSGTFTGNDTFKGRPIVMRFRWLDIHSARPHWEQAFSADGGNSWEVNWENFFTRTAAAPTPLPRRDDAPVDWDFLVGRWQVKHRRLRQRLAGSSDWDEFGGSLVNWPVLGGHGNVGDNVMAFPGQTVRGIGLRAYDPATAEWLSWWLDARAPRQFRAPLRGRFDGGIGTFVGADEIDGRAVLTRVIWSQITPQSARWEQACSADRGKTWETNWVSEFQRTA